MVVRGAKRPAAELECGRCTHWNVEPGGGSGSCRRYPPQVLAANTDGSQVAVWPITAINEPACGEFKPRLNG